MFSGQEVFLSDQDMLDLARLNISADDRRHSLSTTHYDGGLGRFIVTPFGEMEGDEEALGLPSNQREGEVLRAVAVEVAGTTAVTETNVVRCQCYCRPAF